MAGDVRYTPEQMREAVALVVAELADGIPITVACREAGIARSTFYKWLQEHPEFERDVTKADGKRQAKLIRDLRTSGAEDWRSHSWQLERTSEDFRESKDLRVHVEKGVQQTLEAVRERISASAWNEVINAIAAIQGLDEDDSPGDAGHRP